MERHIYIDGVKVIRYEPTALESIEFNMNAVKVRERIQKALQKQLNNKEKKEQQKRISELLVKLESEFAL